MFPEGDTDPFVGSISVHTPLSLSSARSEVWFLPQVGPQASAYEPFPSTALNHFEALCAPPSFPHEGSFSPLASAGLWPLPGVPLPIFL